MIDKDGDGFIDTNEFRCAVPSNDDSLETLERAKKENERWDTVVKTFDKNGDNKLSFEEFEIAI